MFLFLIQALSLPNQMKSSNTHILIIGTVWPEPNSSAAGTRMVQLLDFFLDQGWRVSFASGSVNNSYRTDLEEKGIECHTIRMNSSSFDSFITDLNPSHVLFDRFLVEEQYGWRVAENCPNAIRILDSEDLQCLRKARQKALKERRIFTNDELYSDLSKREIASIYRCDLTLIISSFEMELLTNFFNIDPSLLCYLPFLIEFNRKDQATLYPSFEDRRDFIFIGNFLHDPNMDAVIHLKKTIWPSIREKLPEAKLHVYGAYPNQQVNEFNDPKTGFLVHGRANKALEVMAKARVNLVPLRFGAGLKGKLIDSMMTGTPNVTTTIGAEGMQGDLSWGGIIEDDDVKFIAGAIHLYSNEELWSEKQGAGFQIIEKNFKKTEHSTRFMRILSELEAELVERREKNFIGQMLMHHTLQSTKYLSRWIEEKNRKV